MCTLLNGLPSNPEKGTGYGTTKIDLVWLCHFPRKKHIFSMALL
jgi:hypothetical protein